MSNWDPMRDPVAGEIERISHRYESELLELALESRPDDFMVLVRLGELYSHLGRVRDGLAIDLQLVVLAPSDPVVRYNLACSFSLLDRPAAALAALKQAVRLGYRDEAHLMEDPDLDAVRALPAFQEVLALIRDAKPSETTRESR